MRLRLPQLKLKPTLMVVLSAVSLAGAAYLTQAPTRPIAKVLRPSTTSTTTPISPAVAGASSAPVPWSTTSSPAQPSSATGGAAVLPASTVFASAPVTSAAPAATPAPRQYVALTVAAKTGTITADITFTPGMDACSILAQAQAEGKISSYTTSDQWLGSTGSLMVTEINGYTGAGWVYSVKDAAGMNPPNNAPGCSLNTLQPGYSVTWKPA